MTLDLIDRNADVMVWNHFPMRNSGESANQGDMHQSPNSSFPHGSGNTFPHTCVCVCYSTDHTIPP